MYEHLSGGLLVCFLYNILVLNFLFTGNQPQRITLMYLDIMQQPYPVFSFIVPYFSLVLFKRNVRKQLTKECTLKKCTLGQYVLSKTKTCRMIIEVFHFYPTCFILPFLLRQFFKTVGKILHLLTLYSYRWKNITPINFSGCTKEGLQGPGRQILSNTILCKNFPSPLASTLHIRFYLY